MEKVILKPILHRQRECIGIYFAHDPKVNSIIQKMAGATWSKTKKVWYILLSRENYERLRQALEGKAHMDISGLREYLNQKKWSGAIQGNPDIQYLPATEMQRPSKQVMATGRKANDLPVKNKPGTIHAVNEHVLPAMRELLLLKAFSKSTIRTYLTEMAQLLYRLNNIPAEHLTPGHLKRYLVFCYEKLGLSENTLHSRINAMKFYYEQVLKREKFFWEIPRPKKQVLLPRVFNQDEIASIINSVQNKKHKTMLMLAYSAGLRVSEVVALKTSAIDSSRMTIFISQAKGKKDRVAPLSPVLLVMLREYASEYKPDKRGYLFEGSIKGSPYHVRSLQEVLQDAKRKAGVIRPGGVHSLRHSFATHLVDRGTDVTMIQKLLGHNDIKTTMRYLHTSNKDLLKIISPLDGLDLT
jgi:site-specific recombinase XerD